MNGVEGLAPYRPQIDALRDVGQMLWQRGWSVGTSSNYSVVVGHDPLRILITASGKDKGRLGPDDFVVVGDDGRGAWPGQAKSSAETLLHVVAAQQPGVGAVLHTHSVWCTLLSDYFFSQGGLVLEGYEMLKGFAGVTTHETRAWIEIFENTQDIPSLAEKVRERMTDAASPMKFGYLIRKHGLYTWGVDLEEARRHIEVMEFLLECTGRKLLLEGAISAAVVA